MLKRLAACVREYKLSSFLAPFFVTLEVIIEVFIPFLMASILDNGVAKNDMTHILKVGVILVIMAFLSLTFGVLSGKYAAIASAGFAKNLRSDMFNNLQTFSFSNIDKYSTSSLITRLTTDVTNIQHAYQMIIRIAVRSPFMLIFSFMMAATVSAKLAVIFLAIIPILGIGLYLIIRNAHPIFKTVFKAYDKLNSIVQENLRGIRVVKSFVREEHEKEKFNSVSERIFTLFSKAEKLLTLNTPLMQFSTYTCMLLISWFGARMVILSGETELMTGELTSLFSYTMQILMSLMMFSMIFVMMTISKASAERIYEVLEEKSILSNPENPVYEVKSGDISFKNVSFSYSNDKKRLCLKDINIDIKSGETVGIIGSTGSSKSSLVQLIPRLYDTTSGYVSVGGLDVRKYDLDTLRNSVAMVLQKNVLFSGTIKENLRWGNKNASDEDLKNACRLAQADEFIKGFPDGYDTYIEQGGTNVSGGQKQRLCIARALLKNPKILILDDSTSAVDTKTDTLIRKAFAEYLPETTKIIIAQRISSIENADKIIVMDDGTVSAFGTHDELLKTSEIYREVYYSQVSGGAENE